MEWLAALIPTAISAITSIFKPQASTPGGTAPEGGNLFDNIGSFFTNTISGIGSTLTSFVPEFISRALTPSGSITPASQDSEYLNNVARERQTELSLAQKAMEIVNPADSESINWIKNLWEEENNKWGDPNNPNRNVADPAGFKSAINNFISDYSYQLPNTGAALPGAGIISDSGALKLLQDFINADLFNNAVQSSPIIQTPNPAAPNVNVITPASAPAQQPQSMSIPILAIAGIGIAAIFFLRKRGK